MVNFMGFASNISFGLVVNCIFARAANAGNETQMHQANEQTSERAKTERSKKKLIFHLEKLRRKLKNHLSSNARHISNVKNKLEN